jgi:hypothetical protein
MSGAVRVGKVSAAACSLSPARSSKWLARWRAVAAVPVARWASISPANSASTASPVAAWASTRVTSRYVRRDLSAEPVGLDYSIWLASVLRSSLSDPLGRLTYSQFSYICPVLGPNKVHAGLCRLQVADRLTRYAKATVSAAGIGTADADRLWLSPFAGHTGGFFAT